MEKEFFLFFLFVLPPRVYFEIKFAIDFHYGGFFFASLYGDLNPSIYGLMDNKK